MRKEDKMIKSMTGFGRSEFSDSERKITVEIKSVNHRYLDAGIKMPKKFGLFEASIRNLLKEYVNRGKVDVFITYEDYSKEKVTIRYNKDVAQEYINYLNKISTDFNLKNDISATLLSRYPEVLVMEEEEAVDEDKLWSIIENAVRKAALQLVQTRNMEGDKLKEDILGKLDKISVNVDYIEKRSPQTVVNYRKKLLEKLNEILSDNTEGLTDTHLVDENRVATEVVIYADKICVDEETVRLRSHIEHMRATFNEKASIGRKLDFIAQEMNREANTILSKALDIEISDKAIDLKTEIEKVREQIQNIE